MEKRLIFFLIVILHGFCLHAQTEELIESVQISAVEHSVVSISSLVKDSLSNKLNYDVEYLDESKNFSILRQGKDYYSYSYALYNTKSEKLITPFIFKSVNTYDKEIDRFIVNIKQDFGVVNSAGKYIIPCIYSNLNRMNIGTSIFYIAQQLDKWGILDINNSVIVPFEYDKIYMGSGTFLLLEKGNKVQVTDFVSKKVYLSGYEEVSFMYEGSNDEQLLTVKKDGLYNITDLDGVPKLKDWHESVNKTASFFIVSDYGNYGVYDGKGNVVLPQQYDRIDLTERRDNSISFTVRRNGLIGVCDETGSFIIPLEYQYLDPVYGDSLYIAKKNGKYGLISFSNQIVVPFEYKEISFDDNFYCINKGGKYGLMDKKGKVLIPPKYEILLSLNFVNGDHLVKSNPLYLASLNGNEGVVTSSGEIVIPFEYQFQREVSYGHYARLSYPLICRKMNKYGVLDLENKIIVPFQYEMLSQPNPFVFIAEKNGKFGVKKAYSEELILPYEYDFIISSSDTGVLIAYKNGQYKEYDLVGEKLYEK